MIQSDTLRFLKNLHKNNNKDWFDAHRDTYEVAKANFKEFVEELILGISKFDPAVKHLEAKNCIFRINRDVRFSKDKSPYKNNFGASISPGGKKSFTAGYYFHLQPGASFLAGGMWQPEPVNLNAIRQEIDYNFSDFKKIISSKKFKDLFGDLHTENKLKRAPKGYEEDNEAIEYLKLKGFTVFHKLKDEEITSKDLVKTITELSVTVKPFIDFLNAAVE